MDQEKKKAGIVIIPGGQLFGKDLEVQLGEMYFAAVLGMFDDVTQMSDEEYFSRLRIYYPTDRLHQIDNNFFVKSLVYRCDTKEVIAVALPGAALMDLLGDDVKIELEKGGLDMQSLQNRFEEMAKVFDSLELSVPCDGAP
jgi:SHS2 domain-containing protein